MASNYRIRADGLGWHWIEKKWLCFWLSLKRYQSYWGGGEWERIEFESKEEACQFLKDHLKAIGMQKRTEQLRKQIKTVKGCC